MNYLKHLQDIFGDSIKVTEELDYNYKGDGAVCIIKYLQGTNYRDSTIQPIQLSVYTDDLAETKSVLDSFTKTFSNLPYLDGLFYINQIYSTPMVLSNFNQIGATYISQFIISVTLIISQNISDIKMVYIDDDAYETTTRYVSYVAGVDNQRVNNIDFLNNTQVSNGALRIGMTLISKSDTLGSKMRNIRLGKLNINNKFKIKLVYSDNDTVEEYIMKMESHNLNSENQLMPSVSVVFVK